MDVVWDVGNGGNIDYVKDGVLYRVRPRNDGVQIESADQIGEAELLDYPVGAMAHTPGWQRVWEMSAAGEWVPMIAAEDDTEPTEDDTEPAEEET